MIKSQAPEIREVALSGALLAISSARRIENSAFNWTDRQEDKSRHQQIQVLRYQDLGIGFLTSPRSVAALTRLCK